MGSFIYMAPRLMAVLAALQLAACVRVGFEPRGGEGQAADLAPIYSDGAVFAPADNGDCGDPLVLDVKGVATQPVTIRVDDASAGPPVTGHCGGLPELVVLLLNTPDQGMLQHSCTGGGILKTVAPLSGACPGQHPLATVSLSCTGGINLQSVVVPRGSGHLVICRDPSNPPVTVTITTL